MNNTKKFKYLISVDYCSIKIKKIVLQDEKKVYIIFFGDWETDQMTYAEWL